MRDPDSPFYPPRAPWYASIRETGHRVVAASRIHRIPTPGDVGPLRLLAGLAIPGFAFVIHRHRRIGLGLMLLWPTLLLLGIACLGQVPGNLLLGLAMTLHATSVIHLLAPWLQSLKLHLRLLGAVAATFGVMVFLYLPAYEVTSANWFQPIVTDQGPVVVRPTHNPAEVRRGSWIVHETPRLRATGLIVHSGVAFAPVLALPGDTVEFHRGTIRVNGTDLPRQDNMPTDGSLVVQEGHWFVWPRLNVVANNAGLDGENLRGIALGQASIPFPNLRGIAFKRWFHREQILTTP